MALCETTWNSGSFYFDDVCSLFTFAVVLFTETLAICTPIASTLLVL